MSCEKVATAVVIMLLMVAFFFFFWDLCWKNESECAQANFELQAKQVKIANFGRN